MFRLVSDPSACVRFDRHAVYLGRPGPQQRCPAHAVGRTEAILVEPLAAVVARSGAGAAPLVPEARTRAAGGAVGQLVVPARGVVVTATWANHPGTIDRALGVKSIPASGATAVSSAGGEARSSAMPDARQALRPPAASSGQARFNDVDVDGLGFDTCSAPSATAMSTWLTSSPFRAAAIYIGGANSACAQPNLSASWVSAESAAGWQLIPVYVGLQAPTSSCGCAEIVPAKATADGSAAASDAIAQAAALGIGPGNPIYFDMEAYTRTATATSAVLAFLSAWTSELTASGYISGVYSSATSGITDMVDALGTPFVEPNDIWIADWNNEETASDPYVPASDWYYNQRLHQYRGGHIDDYGGVKLDVDTDYLDGATATAGSGVGLVGAGALPDGTFVSYEGKVYRLAGGAPLYVHSWTAFGGAQPTIPLVATQWKALNPVPANGTFIRATATGKVYRIAGGAPIYVPNWSAFGGPQPTITVDRWDILNISSAAAHLRSVPANGTVVEGLPSGHYWLFNSGMRALTAASATALGVSDGGLTSFLESPTASRVSLSGITKRESKLRFTVTAGTNAPALKAFEVELPAGMRFVRSALSLADGVLTSSASGKRLESTVRLRRGALTITLSAAARVAGITVGRSALYTTKALAAGVKAGTDTTLAVVVVTTDKKHERADLTLDPRVSSSSRATPPACAACTGGGALARFHPDR